jgi:hypothetical protein
MKKSKLLILGLIALMLAGGLALASCDVEKCNLEGTCDDWINCTDSKCATKKANDAGQGLNLPKCDC